MRLFIAEKPSVAAAIASALGGGQKSGGYYQCGTDAVTWCVGHMFEIADPDVYLPSDAPTGKNGKKVWRAEDLPIIPTKWVHESKEDTKAQLATIGKLLKSATTVVHAGDPDREGQLLVDDVLEHFRFAGPVVRFWTNAQDAVTVRRALVDLKPNAQFVSWGKAARARQYADWLIGINLTRAMTLRAQRGGSRALLAVGRVQTPTLSLVVARDRQIEAFKPIPYHTITAAIEHPGGGFSAKWKAAEDQAGLDPEGRLIDTTIANSLVAMMAGKVGQVVEYTQEPKKLNPPICYSLTDVTVEASRKFGHSAKTVLDACQALYERHKLTSYPRTDCGLLPEAQHADAPRVLAAIAVVNPALAPVVQRANPQLKSPTWNDKKMAAQGAAHHGIIPTMEHGSIAELSPAERDVYSLIVRRYLAQFFPVHEYQNTTIQLKVAGETLTASGNVVTVPGWKQIYTQAEDDADEAKSDESQALPKVAKGDEVTLTKAERKDAKTKAPPYFTEGTLGQAMENIHKFVDDANIKKMLRDGDGIGTPATRAAIISELKRHGYLEAKQISGKKEEVIVSTLLARSMIDALPEMMKTPVLTALNERTLKAIEQGQNDIAPFIATQEQMVRQQVERANAGSVAIAGGKEAPAVSSLHKCMACGHGLVRRPSAKFKGRFWWGCSNFPTCQQTYEDLNQKPNYGKGRNGAQAQPSTTTTNDSKE